MNSSIKPRLFFDDSVPLATVQKTEEHIDSQVQVTVKSEVPEILVNNVGKTNSIVEYPESSHDNKTKEETVQPSRVQGVLNQQNKGQLEKSPADKSDRVSTGIDGIDKLTEGGFRKNTVNLVAGGPGSGKSIFGMQFLVAGIEKRDEAGIYISFEESSDKIIGDFTKFTWPLKEYISKNKLVIVEYTPEQVQNLLLSGGGPIREIIDSAKAKNLVIDSLTAFSLLHDNDLAKRRAMLQLFETLWKWGITTIVIDEHDLRLDNIQSSILEFEVDSVIHLYNTRKGDIRERSIEVFKMRATSHSPKIMPLTISTDGITVYPDEIVF